MPADPRAQFVVSIDLEMSWGAVHHGRPHNDAPYRREREIVRDVLAAMDRHGISATWAIVGHLFLESCAPVDGVPHPDVVRPEYPWLEGDWYDLDPGRSVAVAPTWYGPDLVTAIRECITPQEIGSHAFGHLIAGEPGCSAEAFASDVAAARAVAADRGTELRSFVFPRNSIGHLDLLAASGFVAYRGATPLRFAERPDWQRRLLTAVDTVWPLAASAVRPQVEGPLVNIPHTYMFNPDSSTAERLGTGTWVRLMRRRLRHAVRTTSLFHLWFHTHNLANRPERAEAGLEAVFAEARRLIDAGRMENLTMGQIADRMIHEPT